MLQHIPTHTLYTQTEREALTNARSFRDPEAMQARVPALFTTTPHPSLSERYSFTNTYDIVRSAIDRGYKVTSITGGEKKYSKMLIRMRHTAYDRDHVGAPELVLRDSHDGSSSLTLLLGYIRFICSNGMIVSDNIYAKSFMHIAPDLHAQVLLELDDVMTHMERVDKITERMRSRVAFVSDQIALADAATVARFGTEVSESFKADLRPKWLERRRGADQDRDLFTVMNVIQENVMRGGMEYRTRTQRRRMQDIRSVDRNVSINQHLWHTAQQLLAA